MGTVTSTPEALPEDLRHHGDTEVRPGLLDVAVNVRGAHPPPWLRAALEASLDGLAAYPDQTDAVVAVAERHGRQPEQILLTSGAAEAFVLLARALDPRCAVVVHPQFTEPEAALLAAGHAVGRVVLSADDGFAFDPSLVPADADLVVVGNPTNPTGVLHPADDLASLCRPGRVVVVDEAFMDFVPDEVASLAGATHTGLVVVRSLTKMWALAGLRVGYLVGDPAVLARLRAAQPLWPVSAPALAAVLACSGERALEEARQAAIETATERERYAGLLRATSDVEVYAGTANFLLLRTPGRSDVRTRLRAAGIAVRRGDTFPGLGAEWMRITVRDPATNDRVAAAVRDALASPPS